MHEVYYTCRFALNETESRDWRWAFCGAARTSAPRRNAPCCSTPWARSCKPGEVLAPRHQGVSPQSM